ncbi:hypothetical protein CYMTET_7594 [Cymbomonas tetramitiformis]|uniref:Carbohydrate-binding module family 96 domain-containing protein n=1 Tax=Cymbomonas tetramitiformis TaxID=36881 RepID=A0AAE0GUQ2_9CHLO|nr:hypothetical protein CYMTET_7594 [Cymbomonas tetramitiformis]
MIFPNEQGVTMEHFTIDTKQDSRLGELTADFAQTLFQDTGFTAMRIPLRAAYYPDWNYTSCPWSGHPYLGFVNASAYACSVSDITNAQAAFPDVTIFASLKEAQYNDVSYTPFPDYCMYNETDIETGAWDGDKSTQLKAKEYATLIADFLNYFGNLGIIFDLVGIENETNYITAQNFLDVVNELASLLSSGYLLYAPKQGYIMPEEYSPQPDWVRDLINLDGISLAFAAGTHYYGINRDNTKNGQFNNQVALIEFANAVPNGMPKWQTEVHYASADDFVDDKDRLNATQIDSLENMVLQFADYMDWGFTGFAWWSYRKSTQSVDKKLQFQIMYNLTMSLAGATPVDTVDSDGRTPTLYSLVTRSARKGNQMSVWISNNKDGRYWDAFEVVLASGSLAACGATEYSAVSYVQYYQTQDNVTLNGLNFPAVAVAYGYGTITASNAFTLPIPNNTVTLIMFNFTDGAAPDTVTTNFNVDTDVSVQQEGDPATDPSATTLLLNANTNSNASYGLFKFQTPGLTGTVMEATLNVYVTEAIAELLVASYSTDYDASNILFSTMPTQSELILDAVEQATANEWVAFNVTFAFVDYTTTEYAFLLSTTVESSTYLAVDSSESSNAPYLVVRSLEADPEASGVCTTPPAAPPPAPIEYCLQQTYAKCSDYTSQDKYDNEDDVISAAKAGGFAGYSWSSEKGKAQLFTSSECTTINDDNLSYNWTLYSTDVCAPVSYSSSASMSMDTNTSLSSDDSDDDGRRRLAQDDTDDLDDGTLTVVKFIEDMKSELIAVANLDASDRISFTSLEQTSSGTRAEVTVSFLNNASAAEAFLQKIDNLGHSAFSEEFRQKYATYAASRAGSPPPFNAAYLPPPVGDASAPSPTPQPPPAICNNGRGNNMLDTEVCQPRQLSTLLQRTTLSGELSYGDLATPGDFLHSI